MTKTKNTGVKVNNYSDDDINSLSNMEHIRLRYGMTMGADPANHMINEVLDNTLDEFMNGFGKACYINFDEVKNEISVQDEGRGIPVGINSKFNKPTIEMVFTDPNTGGKFNNNSFKISAGLNGTGLKGVTALCEFVRAESERDGKRVAIEFSKGKVITPYHEIKAKGKNGTLVVFRPDKELLKDNDVYKLSREKLINTCNLRTYLSKGFNIKLNIKNNEGKTEKYNFIHENGILDYMNDTVSVKLYNMEPIFIEQEVTGVKNTATEKNKTYTNTYEIVFLYNAGSSKEEILSFANGIKNSKGKHEEGFKYALTNIITKFINDNDLIPKKHKKISITGEDIRKGLTCIINCKVNDCVFTGQIKDELGNPEVKTEIIKVMNNNLPQYMESNKPLFKKICSRIIQFAIATDNVKKAQDKIVKLGAANSLNFSTKYIECSSENPDEATLFICEGKSAGGSLRKGRDGRIHAIYELRGKPLNTFNASNDKLIDNFEINELMLIIFGTNNTKEIDYDKINFHTIVFIADSDDDGCHITSLLSLLFREHFAELIRRGYIYVACPPKYRITTNNKNIYFKNDYEYDTYKADHISKKYTTDIPMYDIIKSEEEFKLRFNLIKDKYAIPSEIVSMILSEDKLLTVAEYLDEQGLDVTEINDDEYYVQGLMETNEWLDVELTKDMQTVIKKELTNIYGQTTINITEISTGDEYECDIIDALELLNKAFNFERYRYKGLTKKLALILLTCLPQGSI